MSRTLYVLNRINMFANYKGCGKEDNWRECAQCEFKRLCDIPTCYGKRESCKGCGYLNKCTRAEAMHQKQIIRLS